MVNVEWGPLLMPKTYSNLLLRYAVFKRLYWNLKLHRVMWLCVLNEKGSPVVLLSIPKATGTSYHRILLPIRRIVNKYPNDYIFIYALPATIADRVKCDILLLHRARPQHDVIINYIKSLNLSTKKPIIINNIDDLLYLIPKTHYLYQLWILAGKDKMSKKMFRLSNYNLITSWHYLKTILRDIGYNVIHGKTHRFPNWIDSLLPQWCYSENKKQNKKIKIGWIGLVSHNIDLIYIKNIWKPLSLKYKDKILFVISLPSPQAILFRDKLAGLTFTRPKNDRDGIFGFSKYVMDLFSDIKDSNIHYVDAVPLSLYGKLYRDLDISFVVVQPTKFNKAKSLIKITLSVLNRCIPVYNNFGPYSLWDLKCRTYIKKKYGNDKLGILMRRFLNLCSHNIHNVNMVDTWVRGMSLVILKWNEPEFIEKRTKFLDFVYLFNMNEYGLTLNIDKRKLFYDMICKLHNIKK